MNTDDAIREIDRLKKENNALRRAIEELTIINDIAAAISSTISLDRILNLVTKKCQKHLKVEQCAILLLDEDKSDKPFQTRIRHGDTVSKNLPYHLDTQLSGWMLKNKKPLISNDFANDNRFRKTKKEDFPVHSIACVPLITHQRMIGLLAVFNKIFEEDFTDNDQRLLYIIATQSAQVIENARLVEEEQELIQMQREVQLAHDIQVNLLPKEGPTISGYDIMGKSIPARDVGGDYFDFIPLADNRLAFCVGDISGKGIPAALLMSNLQATVRGHTILNASAKDCLSLSNSMMFQNTDPEKFASLFYAILEAETHTLCFANAGHNYPLLFSKRGKFRKIEGGGIVLGCLDSFTFLEEKIQIDPGNILVLFSDGVTEAENNNGQEFGETGLVDVVNKNWKCGSGELIDKIITAVQIHAGDLPQMDDITLVILKRTH